MAQRKPLKTLRIGMIGAGFIARFHLESFTGVRNCAITGVYSPTKESRTALAKRADELGLGPCTAHASLDKLTQAKDGPWTRSGSSRPTTPASPPCRRSTRR